MLSSCAIQIALTSITSGALPPSTDAVTWFERLVERGGDVLDLDAGVCFSNSRMMYCQPSRN